MVSPAGTVTGMPGPKAAKTNAFLQVKEKPKKGINRL